MWIKSRKKIQRPVTFVFVLYKVWAPGPARLGLVFTRPGLERCLFVNAKHYLVGGNWPGIEAN